MVILPFALSERIMRGFCRKVRGNYRMSDYMRGCCGVSCAAAGILRGGNDRGAGGFVSGKRGSARFLHGG